jgi:GntR family transcriptional regulator
MTTDIAGILETRIAAHNTGYEPGDQLPGEHALMAEFKASRYAVRAAYGELQAKGLIETAQGARRRVVPRVVLDVHLTRTESRVATGQLPTPGADSWAHDVATAGHHGTEELEVRILPSGQGTERQLLRYVDGRPHNLATWWFPAWIADGTLLNESADIPGGSIPYLTQTGHTPTAYTLKIDNKPPTGWQAHQLAIPHGISLTIETRTGLGADGLTLYHATTLWPGDRASLHIDQGGLSWSA